MLSTTITPHGRPEELFAVAPLTAGRGWAAGAMTLGAWLEDGPDRGDAGRVSASGALGVLLDDVVGQAVLSCMPDDRWTVTTELSLNFPLPLPTAGRVLAESKVVHADAAGGTADGRAVHEDGTVVATATVWGQAVPGVPALGGPATGGEDRRRAGLLGALGAREVDGGGLTVEPSPWLDNAQGVTHGGILACLAEMCGRRAASAVPGGRVPWRTSSVHVVYLRPAMGPLTVVPEPVHVGRSLASIRVRVIAASAKPVANASVLLRSSASAEPAGAGLA
ncbi:PaaI family thioesterase [Pseudonocardia sp. RS11V-5]|uniref:PaaI family thioesterase n=1 Tax=Pseudonocardia terrae TaxID=2905831 RepID=UPI001E2A5081|nr:PaaI family thioesterase [Pseudonocardia terrae]MCE3554488.1 PaaI family thioesterase [Pseudonocardia terrae]